ncbi:MAG: hypothetical protein JNL32_05820, partial [Candidatus Kapabacteria bacterium]|nr:hypothetical protein [Candidatus Kapabacteria bacterium]
FFYINKPAVGILTIAVETRLGTPLRFIPCGEIDIKGKGIMKTYFLERA